MRNFYNNHLLEERRKSIFIVTVEMVEEEMKGSLYDNNIKVHQIQCLNCSFIFINLMVYCIKAYEQIPNKYGLREHFQINSKEVHFEQVSVKKNI